MKAAFGCRCKPINKLKYSFTLAPTPLDCKWHKVKLKMVWNNMLERVPLPRLHQLSRMAVLLAYTTRVQPLRRMQDDGIHYNLTHIGHGGNDVAVTMVPHHTLPPIEAWCHAPCVIEDMLIWRPGAEILQNNLGAAA